MFACPKGTCHLYLLWRRWGPKLFHISTPISLSFSCSLLESTMDRNELLNAEWVIFVLQITRSLALLLVYIPLKQYHILLSTRYIIHGVVFASQCALSLVPMQLLFFQLPQTI